MPLEKRQLKLFPQDIKIDTWNDLKPYADILSGYEPSSVEDYGRWIENWFEFGLVVAEEYHWRYIRQSQNTADPDAKKRYNEYFSGIENQVTLLNNQLEKKALSSPYLYQFEAKGFDIIKRAWQSNNDLFVESNVELQSQSDIKANEYNAIRGPMVVILDNEALTLQQAATRLEWPQREKREEAWLATRNKMYESKDAFDAVMDSLIKIRHQIALNAGFENYRDYMFKKLQRFDYGTKEAFDYHEAVEKKVVPLLTKIYTKQKETLGLDKLRPWDTDCDPYNRQEIKAFDNTDEFIEKMEQSAHAIDPDFGRTISDMKKNNMFDVDSRPNKTSGAYNASMPISRTSFMSGNFTGVVHDLVTGVHEGGHAWHAYLMMDLSLTGNEGVPMEMAELASMSMELISHDQWHRFMPDEEECNRAKLKHYQDILYVMVLVAKMDSFQHALYENPAMTPAQRHEAFKKVEERYDTGCIDYSGLEHLRNAYWHNQRHLFGMPFYMLEYGFAQTGALGINKNYDENPDLALQQYKKALSSGYQIILPELYKTAGVEFDFGVNKLDELMAYLEPKIEGLSLKSKPKI